MMVNNLFSLNCFARSNMKYKNFVVQDCASLWVVVYPKPLVVSLRIQIQTQIKITGKTHLLHRMFFWRSGKYTKAKIDTDTDTDTNTNTLYTTWCTESFSSCQSDRAEAFLVRLSSHFHLMLNFKIMILTLSYLYFFKGSI